MKKENMFSKAINEVRFSMSELMIFDAVADSIIVYLLFYLLFSLFDAQPAFAFYIAIASFFVFFLFNIRKSIMSRLGKAYPELEDQLRAALDNEYKQNPVVQELKQDVTRDVAVVQTSSFMGERRTYFKAVAIVALSFFILFLAPVSLGSFDLNKFTKGVGDSLFYDEVEEGDLTGPPKYQQGGLEGGGEISDDRDIYGEKAVAQLGDKTLKITINPVGYELNVRNVGVVERREFEELYPEETFINPAETFEENIPKEHQELVKNYFNMLAG